MALSREGRVWTYEDYCQLPDDGNRYEIIDGRLYITPAPTSWHQILSRRLQHPFYELERKGLGYAFNAPTDLFIPGATPVQPDLLFLLPEQKSMIHKKGIYGAPTLIVEILSPSTERRDRTLKLNKYAKCGVLHYWLVDPRLRTFEAYRLNDSGHYVLLASLAAGDRYLPDDFEGVTIDMDELFADLPEDEDADALL